MIFPFSFNNFGSRNNSFQKTFHFYLLKFTILSSSLLFHNIFFLFQTFIEFMIPLLSNDEIRFVIEIFHEFCFRFLWVFNRRLRIYEAIEGKLSRSLTHIKRSIKCEKKIYSKRRKIQI